MQIAPHEDALETAVTLWAEPQRNPEIDAAWKEYKAAAEHVLTLSGAAARAADLRVDDLFYKYLRLRDAN